MDNRYWRAHSKIIIEKKSGNGEIQGCSGKDIYLADEYFHNSGEYCWTCRWDMLLHVQKNIRWHCRAMLLHGLIINGCMLLLSNLCWFDIAGIKSAMLLPSCYYWMFKILLKLHWFYNCLNTTWPCNSMALHWSPILNGLSCTNKTLRLAHNAFKIADDYFSIPVSIVEHAVGTCYCMSRRI